MAQSRKVTIGTEWTPLNTDPEMYIIQNRGNEVLEVQYSATTPTDGDGLELKPNEILTGVLMEGLAFARAKKGNGVASVTE